MKRWFRWILILLTVGGGFTGLVTTVQAMSQPEVTGLIYFLIYGAFVILYLFTVLSGLLFADNPRCTIPAVVALALQIPWVSSPILAYSFSAGFRLSVVLSGAGISFGYRFGSDWQFFLFRDRPWAIGANIFSLVVLILLRIYTRTPNKALQPTATAPSVLTGI